MFKELSKKSMINSYYILLYATVKQTIGATAAQSFNRVTLFLTFVEAEFVSLFYTDYSLSGRNSESCHNKLNLRRYRWYY